MKNFMNLEGKKYIVFGVANKRSIAWGIAKCIHQHGGEVFLAYQNERLQKKVEPLAQELNAKTIQCDATVEHEVELAFKICGKVDGVVHSIAFAPVESISSDLSDVSKDDFALTMDISVRTLLTIVKASKPYLNNHASILAMTYIGSERVMTGYNLMGVAKAALEASVRYLSIELGQDGHRINAISAGPIKTLSSSVFPKFNDVLELVKERTPLKENITSDDVGELASFLLSDGARLITGGTHYIDSGANIVGA